MTQHGTRKTRAASRQLSWRGRAARAHGELWEARDRIAQLEATLEGWLRSQQALEWFDDDSPLVRQTKKVLGDE